jgi:hypothetical protein
MYTIGFLLIGYNLFGFGLALMSWFIMNANGTEEYYTMGTPTANFNEFATLSRDTFIVATTFFFVDIANCFFIKYGGPFFKEEEVKGKLIEEDD